MSAPPRGLALPSLKKALRLARTLTILDQETAQYIPFVLNAEQIAILSMALVRRQLVIGKGRQIGSSTVIVFLLMLIAIMNPGVPICIVGDSWDTADGLLEKVRHWLEDDMGVVLIKNDTRTKVLPNGAIIVGKTANSRAGNDDGQGSESKVGRSKTFAVVYATEQAFWANARAVWASLTSTATGNQILLVDSTGSPGETLYKEIVDDAEELAPTNDPDKFVRMFFGVEQHENYRRDPASIDDATWEKLKKEHGFTRRDSAAWWWMRLTTKVKDAFRMLREFPVLFKHMFTFRLGQHITKWTLATDVEVQGLWNVYRDPDPTDPAILGVDTALGLGDDADGIKNENDASAMYLMGWRTGLPYATWRSFGTPIVQYTKEVLAVIGEYDPVACVVETNGCGTALYGGVMHVPCVEELNAGNLTGEVQRRRDAFRDRIEAGEVPVFGHVLEEIKQSVVKAKKFQDGRVRGYFAGHDDVLSAGSFANQWREENPWKAPKPGDLGGYEYFTPRAKKRAKVHH